MPGRQPTPRDPVQIGEPLHIVSLSVRTSPSNVQAAQDAVCQLPGAEIHAVTKDGQIVITIEADNEAQILATMSSIRGLAGVISLALTFHQVEFLEST
jgi:nitrate reductase NapD